MGLIDEKRKIFTTIAAYTSLDEHGVMPDVHDLFPSINSKKDIIPFLLDILKVLVGADAIKRLIGELFSNFVTTIEPTAKASIKKQLTQINANESLPSNFKTNGIKVKITSIDINGKYKKTDADSARNLLLDNNINSFDSKIGDAIRNEGTEVIYENILLIKYDSTDNTLTIKPHNSTHNNTIGSWLMLLVDAIVIINKKALIAGVMDSIYGTITSELKKNVEETRKEVENHKRIEQVIDNDDLSFEINPNDNNEILEKAANLSNGITKYDMGCGMVSVNLGIEDLTSMIEQISGSTDPFFIGNAFDAIIDTAAKNDPLVTKENRETIKDGFFQKLIRSLSINLSESITLSPQIRTILAISSSFQNNGIPEISFPSEDLIKFKIFIKCNIDEMMKILIQYIFGLVTGYLIKLLNPIIRKIIKEKTNQYINILKSLVKIKL